MLLGSEWVLWLLLGAVRPVRRGDGGTRDLPARARRRRCARARARDAAQRRRRRRRAPGARGPDARRPRSWPPPVSIISTAAPRRSARRWRAPRRACASTWNATSACSARWATTRRSSGCSAPCSASSRRSPICRATQGGGAGAVMAGISEALVATAVGLMVAIPAVIAFNFFQGKVRKTLARVDAVAHLVLATIRRRRHARRGAGAVPRRGEGLAPWPAAPAATATTTTPGG